MFDFVVKKKDKKARTGKFTTPHGAFSTPNFMPVATYGAVKTLSPAELREIGAEIILSNTYHLDSRPGSAAIKKLGGLHDYMGWDGPILTDSGGFQVYSLGRNVKIHDTHMEFRSPLNGDKKAYTPADIVRVQAALGVDIAMQLDDAAPSDSPRKMLEVALRRTLDWAKISVKAARPYRERMALFPIVQGGIYSDLRTIAAENLAALDTPGLAIGGLVGGETKQQFLDILEHTLPLLPRIRYVMGIGDPRDIVQAVLRGADIFDCVLPTRLARHGTFFIDEYGTRASISNARFRMDKKPLSPLSPPSVLPFSRAYIRTMFMQNESFAQRLLTLHNLAYMFRLMKNLQKHIAAGTLTSFARNFSFSADELAHQPHAGTPRPARKS